MGKQEIRAASIGILLALIVPFSIVYLRSKVLGPSLIATAITAATIVVFLFATEEGPASGQSWRLVRRILAFGIPLLILAGAFFGLVCALAELVRVDDALGDWVVLVAAIGALMAVAWIAVPGWGRMRAGPEIRRRAILLVGGICGIVTLSCWPLYSVLSRRGWFLAGFSAEIGIAFGIFGVYWALAVMLISRFSARRTHPTTGD